MSISSNRSATSPFSPSEVLSWVKYREGWQANDQASIPESRTVAFAFLFHGGQAHGNMKVFWSLRSLGESGVRVTFGVATSAVGLLDDKHRVRIPGQSVWSGSKLQISVLIIMDHQQAPSHASSALFSVPRVLRFIPLQFDTLLTILDNRTRRIGRIIPRLPQLRFRERNRPKWTSEVRGGTGPKDFVVVILAHYPAWITTVKGKEKSLQLDTVCNDSKVLLKALGYAHGDTSRRWYFVTDFEVDHKDINGVVKSLPRAVYPGTVTPVLPTKDGILGILWEASAGGGSGFVHCGVHCMYTAAGTSHITQVGSTEEVRYTQIPNGSSIKEAFIVTTDGKRLSGLEFIEALGDGTDERCGTTLTVSLDMCHATAFLAGMVGMAYQCRDPDFGEDDESSSGEATQEPVTTTRSTNQLVVISASQAHQFAGEFGTCGAMTYFLSAALISEAHRLQGLSAADVIRFIHDKFQKRPEEYLRQIPQITARYPLTGRFWLLPDPHSML